LAGVPGVISATDYAMKNEDFRAKLAAQGIEVSGSTPQALRAELVEEIAKWSRVIAEAGIKPD